MAFSLSQLWNAAQRERDTLTTMAPAMGAHSPGRTAFLCKGRVKAQSHSKINRLALCPRTL